MLFKKDEAYLQEPETEYVQPRVSPYRLAAHLTSAFAIYSGLFWTALSVVSPYPAVAGEAAKVAMKVRRFAVPVAALVGITAVSGAFVAGNDAVSSPTASIGCLNLYGLIILFLSSNLGVTIIPRIIEALRSLLNADGICVWCFIPGLTCF